MHRSLQYIYLNWMYQNIQILFLYSLKIKLWLNLKKTLWVVSYSMLTQLKRSLCSHTSCWGFWGRQDGTVHWECSHALWLLPWWERWPGISQAQFIPARWQVPLEPAVFQFWKEKAENTHVYMVCCCLGLAEQYIISLTCAVLVTFISVAECGGHTVLSLLCVKCTLDSSDSLKRNYRWCRMVPLTVSTNTFK